MKPCPFCGSTSVSTQMARHVACYACGARGPVCTDADAAWNAWDLAPRARDVRRKVIAPSGAVVVMAASEDTLQGYQQRELMKKIIAADRFDLLDHDLDDDGRIVYRMRERVAA